MTGDDKSPLEDKNVLSPENPAKEHSPAVAETSFDPDRDEANWLAALVAASRAAWATWGAARTAERDAE